MVKFPRNPKDGQLFCSVNLDPATKDGGRYVYWQGRWVVIDGERKERIPTITSRIKHLRKHIDK